ncbi:MAG: acyl-CoA dehydrogenase [Acidimicrobiales bacterium]
MAIAISETHREIESVARSFLYKAGALAASRSQLEVGQDHLPDYWEELVELGWLGIHLPEEFGGVGYGLAELAVLLQELGRTLAPGPFLSTVVASAIINRTGTEEQRLRYLPGLADGSRLGAFGWCGTLTLDDGRLDGDGGIVIDGGLADTFVLAVDGDLVVVERESPGFTVAQGVSLDLTRRSSRVSASAVEVTPEQILPGAADAALAVARLLLAAEAAGGALGCVEQATEYAKQRQQFGRVIGAFQAVKHHCANMLVASELATAAVWDGGRAAADGDDQLALAAAVALVQAVPAFLANAQLNIQIHGGIGFTWEHDGHLYLRRAATLASLADVDVTAGDVTKHHLAGTYRQLGLSLPPEAESLRVSVRTDATEIAALPENLQRERLIDTGYIQPHWPKPWGRAAKALEQLVIDEEFEAAGIRRPRFGITAWVILTLIQHGRPDQIARWVRPTLEGELVWCQLFSEPDAGSDAAGIRTRAVAVEGGLLVSGQKVWTSGAQYCQRGLATVRTNQEAPKHQGITTVVIDMQADGVEVRPLREASGSTMFNEVFFNDVFVPEEDIVGGVDAGWTVARSTLGNERVSIGGGSAVGLSLNLVGIYRTYAGTRSGIGLAEEVGRHMAEGQTLQVLNLRAAERAVVGGEPGAEGNVTKLLNAEHMQRSADLGVRIVGPDLAVLEGSGSKLADVLIFSRAMTIAGGTSEITRSQIGERILGLPRDPLIV